MVRKPLPSGEHRIALENPRVQSGCAYLVEIFTAIANGMPEERFPQCRKEPMLDCRQALTELADALATQNEDWRVETGHQQEN